MPVVVPLTGPQRNSQVICFVIRCFASSVSKGFPRTLQKFQKYGGETLTGFHLLLFVLLCCFFLFLY
jgi:hypothetical protein